ncbi:MAG: hypothetical protein GX833_09400 [Clostridium sp.]|nr:hypothetical protein [Clostridium sp.]
MMLNFSNTGQLALDSTYTIKNHPVTLNADLDVYEVTGFDKTVDVSLTGRTASDVNAAKSQSNTKVILDLSGLQTGEHTVKFTTDNFSSRVNVTTKPDSATIRIRKKETTKFSLSHDYLNLNKMDEKYYPGEPEFESTEVLVRASAKTTESIAFVKALIDVKDATETFTTEAPLYAYNINGEKVDVDLIPKIVKVTVPITSPKKTVAIRVVPRGEIPGDRSIDSITLDHSSIELFGNQAVLDSTNEIRVNIDASQIDKDLKIYENIVLPSGLRQASIAKVNLDIKLGPKVSKVLKKLPVAFENNVGGYKTRLQDPEQAEIDVTIYGTAKRLEEITEENFGRVYFDMAGVQPGDVSLPLLVEIDNYFITYKLEFDEINMEVVEN